MTTRQIGEFAVTSVHDGVLNTNHDVVLDLDKAESERLTGIPHGQPVPLDVNVFLIRHGGRTMISDAGSGHTMQPTLGKLPQNLRAIGVDPASIDTILLTHLHPDHSLGLLDEADQPHFPNAGLIVHDVEATFWLDRIPQPADSERVTRGTKQQRKVTAPYRDRIRRIKDGEVMPGITAAMQPGHTPGHTTFLIESGGERLLLWGDIIHLASIQMSRPDAKLVYDVDPVTARASRERVLDMVASERLMVGGAHLPAPGLGYVVRRGGGYAFEPI